MIPLIDTHIGGTIVVTVIMMGFAAWATGRASRRCSSTA